MKNKNKAFQRKSQLLAGGLMILVVAGVFLLSTDKGRNLFSNRVNYYTSKANQGKFRQTQHPITGQYIVVLNANVDADTEASQLTGKYNSHAKNVYHDALNGFSAKLTEAQAKAISEDPAVAYVEEDSIVKTATVQSNAAWDLGRIDNHNGFAYPLDTNYEYDTTGQGVNAYVIDTGLITSLAEFGGRATQPFDATHDWDPSDSAQCNLHGTSVSGMLGSNTYGVAKQVKLLSIKVFPCSGVGSMSDVINGIDYVTKHAVKPAVANLSLSGGFSSTLNQAVQSMINKGVTAVVAAGNYGDNACNYSPSSVAGAIVAGGTDERDYMSSISDWGPCVDVFAPGEADVTVYGRNGIDSWVTSGTSFSSPIVAGAAALYLQTHPTASPAEVQNVIITQATPNNVLNDVKGSPNRFIFSNLGSASTGSGPDIIPPNVTFDSPRNGTTIRNKDVSVKVSATDASGVSAITISLDGVPLKTCYDLTSCSMSLTASTIQFGYHTLSATATDKAATPNSATQEIQINKN